MWEEGGGKGGEGKQGRGERRRKAVRDFPNVTRVVNVVCIWFLLLEVH